MAINLFALFFSFIIISLLIIPFINILYTLKIQRRRQKTTDAFDKRTPIFDLFHSVKEGTPVGGGMLLIPSIVTLFIFFILSFVFFNKKIISNFASVESEIKILLFTFVSFAFLGLYDDLKKIFFWKKDYFFGIRLRHKLILEIILSTIISLWIFFELKK